MSKKSGVRAPVGGTIGVNGHFYKGGRFLPNTQAEPGRWKMGRKWVSSTQEMIEPGLRAWQPTPFSRSIFSLLAVGAYTRIDDEGRLSLYEREDGRPIYCSVTGDPVTVELSVRPGVKGVMGNDVYTLGELMAMYSAGARWIDIRPEAEAITTPPAAIEHEVPSADEPGSPVP